MDAYDLFDVLVAVAYGVTPRTRAERAAALDKADATGPAWLIKLPQPSAKVIRAIARQFEKAGTEALETTDLWSTGEVKASGGLSALGAGGKPAELLRQTKETLFAA